MSRFIFFIAAIVAAAWMAVTPASASSIRVQLNADIRSTTPGINRDDNTDAVILHVVEGLVAYGEEATVRPLLAEGIDVSEDGKTYTFTLRDGVTFHNGAPLTSADVAWSWQYYMEPSREWRCLSEFDGSGRVKVEAVATPDAKTVVFRLNGPSALFLASLARTDCGMTGVLHKDSLNSDGSWDKPIGTGPFKFAEWRSGEFVRLERFENYQSLSSERDGYTGAKRPLVDEVRFMIIPDSAAAKAALQAGDIDIIPDLANADVKEIKGNPDLGLSISPNMGTSTFLFQTRDRLLSNVKLRQAIAAAVDTEQLTAAVTEGLTKRNNSLVPSMSAYHTAVHDLGYTYDPEKAKTLLAEAGYKGEPITLFTNKRYPQSYAASVVAQAMMQAAGINVSLEVLEWATQLDRYLAGNYQMMAFPYSARLDPALSYDAVMGGKDKQPRKAWDSPEAQALLDKAMIVSEPAERQAIFDELHKRFLAEVPFLMLYNGVDAAASSKRVGNYKASILSKPRLWEVTLAE